ncbi:hypothetical protein C0V75_13025 [Tabrizicola sp. TH137]|uniref:hypothetical protein n=1 Tax=Tabrizicola sp. TH137 TaxID=2067452 RepID=UPI000C7D51AE|nr:hypothetical protein [Tabrizicola sp. TH137]PLL11828.1 hypothetical protein C0V75_13025 [Tabrizicola sp. TH137]
MKKSNFAAGLPVKVIRVLRSERAMAVQKIAFTGGGRGSKPTSFPPEASCDFDEVKVKDIKAWQGNLAEEFGFGNGKWVALDGGK